jgi:urease accessory protein
VSPLLGPALHILTEPDHLVACLAIGLLAGQRASRTQLLAMLGGFIAAFLVAFCVAAVASVGSAFESIDAFASAATLIVTGLLVAVPRVSFFPLALAVTLATGTIHGFANGLAASATLAVAGAGGAAALIALAGTLLAVSLREPWGLIAVRVLGSWTAAMGLILFGIALR